MSIEVERKLIISSAIYSSLKYQLTVLTEARSIRDVYYDTVDYRLSSADWWLRNRDGKVHA